MTNPNTATRKPSPNAGLRDRASQLRDAAGRFIRRSDETKRDADLHSAVDHPDGTISFCDASGRPLRRPVADWIGFTVQRLYSQARMEMARQLGDPALDEEDRAALAVKLRRDLRLDALGIAASRSREAFDAAKAAEDETAQGPILAPNVHPSGPISIDLYAAIEARQMMVHDPIQDDDRTDAHVERITALGDAVRAIPARTLADLRHKVIYLWPGSLARQVEDDEVADTFRSFRKDVMGLAARPSFDFLPSPDFAAMSMRTLDTLQDHASALINISYGLAAQPRSRLDDDEGRNNEAGTLAVQLAEALSFVVDGCVNEARRRRPDDIRDREIRIKTLARATLDNGDAAETRAFVYDLLALVGA